MIPNKQPNPRTPQAKPHAAPQAKQIWAAKELAMGMDIGGEVARGGDSQQTTQPPSAAGETTHSAAGEENLGSERIGDV